MGKGGHVDTRIAKSAPEITYEDENVVSAGDNTRRRLAAANSRNKANAFYTAFLQSPSQSGAKKNTLG